MNIEIIITFEIAKSLLKRMIEKKKNDEFVVYVQIEVEHFIVHSFALQL